MNKSFITVFSSIQWLLFIFANTVVVPISIATIFEIPSETVSMMMRSSLIFTGLACIFQGWVGHKFPLMEGHSGLLWGVILNLGLSASSFGMELETIGGGIVTGVLLACFVTLMLVIFNKISILQAIFSPMVMSVYLFLLTFQLILIFFKGMLKINEDGTIDLGVSLLSVGTILLVSILKIKGNKLVSNFSILIGMAIGWFVYELLFHVETSVVSSSGAGGFSFFPLGVPNLEWGIIAVSFIAVMLNLSNTFASINAAKQIIHREASNQQYRQSIFITSIATIAGTGFGLVSYTPFTSSVGFLQSTRILERKPFMLGGGLLTIFGLIPVFGTFLSTMPITIGNAVLFVAYLQLFGTAYSSLNGKMFNSNTIFRIAAPILIGVCLMNVAPEVFANLPIYIQPFLTNGLIMGMLISIVLEQLVKWENYEGT
ncbi:uracil/xanthine transporter [Bacillus sp. BGMRC 2118]|nr:uracil/xanthine transporter [Bacillus sp. BGMRC 2118]